MQRRLSSRVRAVYIWLMAPLLGFAVFLAVLTPTAQAATSSTYLNFQARILGTSGTIVPDGNYNIDFKIYNADSTTGSVGTCSGACLWEETRKNFNSQGVQVINGYFSVNLGSVTAFPAINWDQQLWLTMNIGGTSVGASPTWDGEMQNSGHSIALTALPYSFVAGQLALTSGAHRGTLAFNTVANDPNILLPDASGTVCLQAASACGFEATSGTDFIRNQTTTQTANFNVQSASSGSVAAVIQGAASQSVDLLDLKTSTPSTVLSVGATGSLSVTPASASDTITLGSTSETGTITLGQSTDTNTISIGSAAGNTKTQTINIGTSGTSGSTTNITIGSTVAGTTTIQSATGLTINSNTTVSAGKTLTVTSALTSLTGATSGDALNVSNSTSTGNIAAFKDNSTAVFTIADNGLVTLNPAAALTGSSTQSHISQTLTNNQTGGTVNGLNQAITISNASGTTTTNGLNIALTDNASALANTDTGLKITLNGSNSDMKQYGVDASVTGGIGLRGTSSGSVGNVSCGGVTNTYSIGVCADSTASAVDSSIGLFARSSSAGSYLDYNGGFGAPGSAVFGLNTSNSAASKYVAGVKGVTTGTGTTGTSIGVYGESNAGSGATTYGGYFTLNSGSGSTAGAALYASNSSIAENIVLFQDNTTDVFKIGDGGLITASSNSASGLIVKDSSSSKPVLTVDTTGDAVLLGQSSGLTGKLTFYNNGGSHTVSILGPNSDPASSFSLTLPSALPGSTQCLQSSNTGALSFTTCVTTAAVNTIGTYSSANHYSDGASITGSTLTLGSADATHPGLIDTSSQTFSGAKAFSDTSTTAFQIQDGSNIDFFNVNTTDGYVINNGALALGNDIQNPSFESSGTTESTGWYTPSASQVITNSAANANSGNYELQITGNSNTHAVTTKYFAVHPGDTIYVEAWVKNSGGANGDAGIYLEFSDKDKGSATYSNADTGLPGTSYVLKSIQTTVPASKYFVRVAASVKATSTTGTFYFDDFYLKLANQQAPLLITNTSASAFEVLNSSSQVVFGVDASTSKIFSTIPDGGSAVGFTLNTPSYTTGGAKLLSLQNNAAEKFYIDKDGNVVNQGNITASGYVNIGAGQVYKVNGTQISSANLSNDSDIAKLAGTGPQTFTGNNKFTGTVLVQNNNAAGFQVQHSSNSVFTVDTSGDKVILGAASNITGKIQFQGSGGAGTLTLAGPTTPDVGNYTLTIPAITANANVCTDNTICSGYESVSAATTSLAGKLNKGSVDTSSAAVTAVQGNLYVFTNSSSNIASGVLKIDNGNNTEAALYITGTNDYASNKAYIVVNNTNGTPTGNLIDLQSNGTDEFTVDASGNVVAAGNISIASGKVYEINGVQITSAALSDGSNLAKLNGTQTFTGDNTFSSASNSFTGSGAGLTSLNASNVSSGTLNDGRLSSNVALLNRSAQSFTGDNSFAPTANNVGTIVKQTSGTATSGSVLDVQTANGSSHFLQVTNAAANEGAVTLQSVGATRDLTLGSGSGTIIVAAAAGTIQHNNSGLTIDINNGTDSTLTITNSQGGAVANLSVEGDIAVGASHVYKVGATSGVSVTCTSNTFSQNQVTNGGIVTSNTCANAVTSISASGGSIANGASISGNALTLGYADTSNPGLVSNTTQSFNGNKTFTGTLTVQNNGSAAFQVQNTSARSLFNVDETANVVTIGNTTDGAQITLGATGNANGTIRKTMVVNGSISANDLVEIDTSNAGQVKQAVASSTKIFGVATSATGGGGSQDIVINGIYQVNANSGGGTIAIGDTLVSSTTAGQATKAGTTTSSGSVVGLALSTLSGGKVWVYMNLGLGGSDNLQTVYNKDTGGTTPDLKISSSVGALDIQDADSALNSSLLTVRGSNSSGLGPAILDVQSANPITDVTNNANDNLVTNGSIETGVTGWAKMGSTQVAVAQNATKKYIGDYSLKIVTNATDASGTDGGSYNLTTSTLVSNTQYTLSLYARTEDGTSMSTFEIGRAENGATNTSCLTAQTVSGSGWTQFSCTFTTGTTSSTPYIYVRETDQVARTIYIDAIQLYRTSLLSNQFADQTFAAGDWQAKGAATVTRDTTQNEAGAGTASVKIATSTNASNNDGVKHNITLNDSTMYRLRFWALLDSGSTSLSTMEAGYSSDGSADDTVCITGQSVTTTWTQYSCTFSTPSSHSGTPFFYVKELNTTGVKTFYIDDISLSIGNPLGAYREGQIALNGIINSPVSLQNQNNSSTAFQIQNSTGSSLLGVDTLNTTITVTAGTVNSTLALGNFSGGGSIGSAATTVDIYTSISVNQTTSSQTLTIPTPTASTTYGRVLYLSNIGSQSFILLGLRIPSGTTATVIWSHTNGGDTWQFAGAGGTSIENQNSADQTADFRISGSGRANTSFLSPLYDTATAVTLAIGTTTATAIHLDQNTTILAGKEIIVGTNATDLTCTNGAIYYNTGTNRFKGCENGTWITIDSFVSVNSYTSGDTAWSMPQNATVVQVILIGAGGGGGGGGARNGGQERNGGGGGGGGAYASQIFAAADIASTAHASVGAAGSSGAGAPSSASAGTTGGGGGASCFSSTATCGGTVYAEGYGGGGGGGGNQGGTNGGGGAGGGGTAAVGGNGSNTSNTGGTGGLPEGMVANANASGGGGGGGGSANSNGGTAGNPGGAAEYGGAGGGGAAGGNATSGAGGSSLHGAGAGGAGASTNSGNATGTGGVGGVSQSNTAGGGGAAGTSGSACGSGGDATAGSASTTSIKAGSGGGGGGANGGGGAAGCAGGTGGAPGGGGGGGGSGSTSGGAGGAGGAGKIWVIAW